SVAPPTNMLNDPTDEQVAPDGPAKLAGTPARLGAEPPGGDTGRTSPTARSLPMSAWKIAGVQMDCRFGEKAVNLDRLRRRLREARRPSLCRPRPGWAARRHQHLLRRQFSRVVAGADAARRRPDRAADELADRGAGGIPSAGGAGAGEPRLLPGGEPGRRRARL